MCNISERRAKACEVLSLGSVSPIFTIAHVGASDDCSELRLEEPMLIASLRNPWLTARDCNCVTPAFDLIPSSRVDTCGEGWGSESQYKPDEFVRSDVSDRMSTSSQEDACRNSFDLVLTVSYLSPLELFGDPPITDGAEAGLGDIQDESWRDVWKCRKVFFVGRSIGAAPSDERGAS